MKKHFQTSDIFLLGAAFISFLLSVSLWFYGYKDEGVFVGLWVPSILAFGSYFKQMLKHNFNIIKCIRKYMSCLKPNSILTNRNPFQYNIC